MNTKYTIIALMGKAGSGKDTILHALLKQPAFKNAAPIVSCTTRPMRENEKDGVDYHFLTQSEFTDKILSGDMLEATVFNDWCYGTSLENLSKDKVNIGVFNPEGVGLLRNNENIKLTLIYIEANDKDRLIRQLSRENNPDVHEIIRRYSADEMDFSEEEIEYLEPDCFITNNDGGSVNKIAAAIANAWAAGQL